MDSQNVLINFSTRPSDNSRLGKKKFHQQLDQEIEQQKHENRKEKAQTVHNLIVFLIKASPYIVLALLIYDIWLCMAYWKHPEILFNQVKSTVFYIITFILGGIAEHIRNKIIKSQ